MQIDTEEVVGANGDAYDLRVPSGRQPSPRATIYIGTGDGRTACHPKELLRVRQAEV